MRSNLLLLLIATALMVTAQTWLHDSLPRAYSQILLGAGGFLSLIVVMDLYFLITDEIKLRQDNKRMRYKFAIRKSEVFGK